MNKKPIIITAASILFLGLLAFFYWLFYARLEVSTRDAYVHGNQVKLTPQISGYVSKVYCEETQLVKQGQILVSLDKTDAKIAFEQSCANLGTEIRRVTELFENVYTLAAEVKQCEAMYATAETYFLDREEILGTGAIPQEEFITARDNFLKMKSRLEAAYSNLKKGISLVDNTTVRTHPIIKTAIQELKRTYVNLQRCDVRAPSTGIVAQRGVQVGQSITAATPLLAIVPLDQIWVDANFKEIHMSSVRIGQRVKMDSDYYGSSVKYSGTVVGIAGGTGAVFSPIPPQNATGNWIKIVQRVPVRVVIHGSTLEKYPLRLGLSMNVKVDISDTDGRKIPKLIKDKDPLFETNIFAEQEKGVKEIIEKIFKDNESFVTMISEEVKALGTKK